MSNIVNWNGKPTITLTLTNPTNATIALKQVNFFGADGEGIYTLKSPQSIDPAINSQIEPVHSISNERTGYHQKPTEYEVSLGVLAAKAYAIDSGTIGTSSVSDAEVMLALQKSKIEFTMKIGGDDNSFEEIEFKRCRVSRSNPSSLTIDGLPVSNWTILSLEIV